MPELKNLFIKGKMNKDLDERLVPQGEYRDAQNIDVAFSEGSNVGAIEPIMGHTTQSGFFYNLTDAHCVGSVTDTETDKAYALVYSPSINIIVEYDIIANTKQIVLADEGTILNFSPERLVTGISVLDGVLYYTDNHTEPKQIDIEYWKSKSNLTATVASGTSGQNTVTLTTDISTALSALIADGDVYFFGIGGIPQNVRAVSVSGATVTLSANLTTIGAVANTTAIFSILYTTEYLSEDRITLIRKSPLNAPVFETIDQSLRGDAGTVGGSAVTFTKNFFNVDIDDTFSGSFSIDPNYQVGDVIEMKNTFSGQFGETIESILRVELTVHSGTGTSFTGKLLSKTSDIEDASVVYTCLLEEADPLFELKFAKFSYRYKYTNGQFSTMAPFSLPAFIPDDFSYDGQEGYNLGMVNTVRELKLEGWGSEESIGTISNNELTPSVNNYAADIEEIEILYKDSVSPNVYIVEALKKSSGNFPATFEVKDEQIYKAIQSNQLLRPFDSIPKKAKALEITGNRLIFGNYEQNFNVITNPSFTISIISRSNTSQKFSIKSGRTYQIGIVYQDEYGRQTPVFTDTSGVIKINLANADLNSAFRVSTTHTSLPSELTHYKYYIKEISNPYYNICVSDIYEDTETGYVYCAFPSSETNKVSAEDILILKKQSGNSAYKIPSNNKFKVLDKDSEPPKFLAEKETPSYMADNVLFAYSFGNGAATPTKQAGLTPVPGHNTIQLERANRQSIDGEDGQVSAEFLQAATIGAKLRFIRKGTAAKSDIYTIKSVETHTAGNEKETEITFEQQFGEDVNVIYLDNSDSANYSCVIEFITIEDDTGNPAYAGKFFIKLNNSSQLKDALVESTSEESLVTLATTFPFDGVDDTTANREYIWTNVSTTTGVLPSAIYHGSPVTLVGFHLLIRTDDAFPGDNDSKYKTDPFGAGLQVGNYMRFSGYTAIDNKYNDISEYPNYKILETVEWLDNNNHKYYALKFNKLLETNFPSNTSVDFTVDIRGFTLTGNNTPTNPPIFEIEPEDGVLDIYYETEKTYAIAELGDLKNLEYTNCISFNNGVESDRIRDDFNAPTIGKGVRVSTVFEDNYKEERVKSGLIFSGLYNGKNGINRLNQFIIAENITEEANPIYGSIQKLNTRDTDLTLLCDDKILKVPARKDLLFQADGNPQVTSTDRFLGTIIPYAGNYGCQHPESFANYTYKSYFVDKTRGKVLRLSLDGITEISNYGMRDFFSDICYSHSGYIHGSFDNYKNQYNVSFRVTPNSLDESVVDKTITFSESVNGWVSFKDYIQESGFSLNNRYVTFKDGDAYRHHNSGSSGLHGPAYKSSVTLLLNGNPGNIKNFRTLNYQGQDGWEADTITTDKQTGNISSFIEKEGIYYNYISGETQNTKASLDLKSLNVQGLGTPTNISSNDATFADLNNAIQVGDKVFNNNNSDVRTVQSISGNTITLDAAPTNAFSYFAKDNRFNTSGLLGYYAEIKMETKNNVNSGNRPELYSVGSEVSLSS